MSTPIWYIQESESVEDFKAFTCYLMLPPKKQQSKYFLDNYPGEQDKKELKKLIKNNNWKERARAFTVDNLLNNLIRETDQQSALVDYQTMIRQNIKSRQALAWKLDLVLCRRVAKLLTVDDNGEIEAERIPIKVMSQLIQNMNTLMTTTEALASEYIGVEELVIYMDEHQNQESEEDESE